VFRGYAAETTANRTMIAPPLLTMAVPLPLSDMEAQARAPLALVALSDEFAGACTSGAFMSVEEPGLGWVETADASLVQELTVTLFQGDDIGEEEEDDLAALLLGGCVARDASGLAPGGALKKRRRLVPPSIPVVPAVEDAEVHAAGMNAGGSLKEEAPVVSLPPPPPPPGGPGALLNVFELDPVKIQQRRGGLSAREYRRSKAIPRYLKKRETRDWNKARAPMYKSRTSAASSRQRRGGKFTSAPSGWRSAVEIWPSSVEA